MIAPRNRTDHVPAPVLFRLPHLHAHQPVHSVEQASQPMVRVAAEQVVEPQPATESSAPPRLPPADHRFQALSHAWRARRDLLSKPQVMLGAMLVVAFGSWLAGRQMAGSPTVELAATTAAVSPEHASPNNVAIDLNTPAQTPTASVDAPLAAAPEVPQDSTAVAEGVADFYIPEDGSAPELASAVAAEDADEPLDDPAAMAGSIAEAQAASEEVAAATDPAERFADLSSEVLNQPAELPQVAAAEPAATPAAQPEPAAAPEATQVASAEPAADAASPAAEAAPPAEDDGKKLRRILSRTPHDIPDWTKYLSGASGPVKAASAAGYEPSGGAPPKNERAFYYEQD